MKEIVGQHYDIVVNGVELGGGSIRNHDKDVQKHIFEGMLNLDPESCARFNHLLMALEHGCPPHGGTALGFDRLIAILTNASSLRDVIAFSKSKEGKDLFLNSPAPVSDKELEQYHLKHSTN